MTDLGHGKHAIFTKGLANVTNINNSILRLYQVSGTGTLDQQFLTQNATSIGVPQWQSLTASINGVLDKVSIYNGSGVTATGVTVNIYNGIGTGGTLLSQETGISAPDGTFTDVTLTTKPEIISGQQYTIAIVAGANWGWRINTTGGYPGGSFMGSASDALFRTYVDAGYVSYIDSSGNLGSNFNNITLTGKTNAILNCSTTGKSALQYNSADRVVVNSTGVGFSVQPRFSAYRILQVVNITGDGTIYTPIPDGEIFDIGNNYNNATGVFTAPVTGKYLICCAIGILNIQVAHTKGAMSLITSNRFYNIWRGDPFTTADQTVPAFRWLTRTGSFIVDMDAGDIAYMVVQVTGGTKTIYLDDLETNIQGYLLTTG